MKKKTILMAIFLVAWVFPYECIAGQKAEIENPEFNFEPVPEGTHVSHTFRVKNTGDALLTIEKVMPP